ncbi:MAG: glycosyltransferase, partial [Ignavibacteria bacterium]|nr:glycosyltransferase [Ignavibacteria bacterium]
MQLNSKQKSILLIAFEDQQITEEVKERFTFEELTVLTKAEIVGKSIKEILKLTKSRKYDLLIISNRNSQVNRSKTSLKLLALFSKSVKQLIYFNENDYKSYTKITLAVDVLPKLILGGILGLYVLVKAKIYFAFIDFIWKEKKIPNVIYGKKIAYLRTDLSGKIVAGGSLSHIKGFASGARKLGFEVEFYSDYPVLDEPITIIIKPNPLLDFFDEFQLIDYHFKFYREAKRLFKYTQPNLIYQRHSIFNASGIALSKHFNIPIILEANNSEVWGKKNWSRLVFEKLAIKIERIVFENANVIGVVSEVTKEQIIPLGASEEKIIVNPNGVDPQKFSPDIDCTSIKSKFSLENKVVVGFIGTFTKWHGVEILFESAIKVINKNSNIVFLLIGDG